MDVFDVVIVGGGHAGYEAAFAASRLGCSTLLLSMETTKIGTLSCNPAIGGTAKGHLVKEIDSLGGEMGFITDQVGIQFRMLNKSRGPAVWSPRAQVDRAAYPLKIQELLGLKKNISIRDANIVGVVVESNQIKGVITDKNEVIKGKTVILTCGTFLNGIIHIGLKNVRAGRIGEKPSLGITESLISLGFESSRLKTGTPPRIHKDSINFSVCEPQYGDNPPEPFSYRTDSITNTQIPCHLTYTNDKTHDILKSGFDQSPMFTGRIKGLGPRYCPSIEDKINRFSDKERHQIFLEPEGYDSIEYYVNGFSTSLPEEIQISAIRSVTGLENAHVLRPGYAVEYDFFPPYQINLNMETKYVEGLFFAGQINGTSGYEEAAAQGMMAGINAALKVKQKDPFILRRNEAYIGVLIDDLVNKSTLEPYRIFTSLAEYRLLLRQDNADMRLMEKGNAFGLIDEKQMEKFIRKKDAINQIETWIEKTNLHPKKINSFLINKGSTILEEPEPLAKILKRPEVTLTDLLECEEEIFEPKIVNLLKYRDTLREVDTSIKYDGYLKRQQEQVDRFLRMENKKIPLNFDYDKITSLSKEAREKLKKVKPGNVGQASRISGVSPSDISLLLVFLERGSLGKNIQDSFNDTLN
ncbi:MAG TPA: tRNA uridine-5-carboxymethylaminomethyl(34) synthesis enzyme MnmG [bacterium]|nr:tRNA uridine-5-carboxymethylaminomethyl(34) synthesis enzyme MnmG [bacterium]HMY34909.1 tRNA uridine-5-carboxymethylaminomethyl(34) synthesis enzyme MnmG [bacterium]HNB07916.1 tRNA uridine-5-carboxymethylaminomethyl(34) synthesis enzyme MnmG [bacterium]HND77397.1 tRNA uridine-5-carboxymethylaminomethyl(34) synthesis enzyme MnmG [bacterium]HNH31077.1 tRNA uridine-5-carboxymethylaminomethyl(34) synthesis enzyme MnmG [bacterium]